MLVRTRINVRNSFGTAIISALISAVAATAIAEDFTFRRVKPPAPGVTKRITIQVDKTWPYETPPPVRPGPRNPESVDIDGPDGWFWTAISPALDDADPTRIATAITVLENSPDGYDSVKTSSGVLQAIIDEYGSEIIAGTAGKRVSPALVLAVIAVESGGKPKALSPKGAQGLMQLIPATAERFGVVDVNNPLENIKGGAAYLDWLLGKFKDDPILSLAGYNAGENAVLNNGGVPPYPETRNYVPKVIAAWEQARLLCQAPPDRADQSCVFLPTGQQVQ